jgi:hypothetical protein
MTDHACTSHRLGHHLHWIQVRLALEGDPRLATVEMLPGGWLELRHSDGTLERCWHHDHDHVARLVEAGGGRVLQRPQGVLSEPSSGRMSLSVGREASPCRRGTQKGAPQTGRRR